ncbi:MAG: SPOR domain-containing protein [Nonlabens sp.]
MKKIPPSLIILCFITVLSTSKCFSQKNGKISENQVVELIEAKQKLDQSGDLKDRFTIQLYYGNREAATKQKREYEALSYNWKCDLFWESPNLAVRIGKFRNRLEADQALLKIRKDFPNAIVMKP